VDLERIDQDLAAAAGGVRHGEVILITMESGHSMQLAQRWLFK
jgi:hypothetical protein